ncbi:MAG: tetratricopeptide repeat protein [Phycisphaerae bacterium]|nr:tetratricopeptide repeat protein [Phycisphaerae bacterium]
MHTERCEQAEQNWNHVRAKIKYRLANQQFQRGQIEAAIDTVNEAIATDDSSAEQFLLLAHCYIEQGKIASARKTVDQARRCAPHTPEVEYTCGLIAEHTGQLESALEHYHLARAHDENTMDYLVAEAECLAELGHPEEAAELISENVNRFDSDGTLEMLLAQIALLIGDTEAAIPNLRLAMERSGCGTTFSEKPGGCDVLIEELGRLLSESGQYAETVSLLRPYVQSRADTPSSVVTALCTAYLSTNRVGEAKQLLRDELRHRPGNTRCMMLLVQASVMTGDWMTARRYAEQLERLTPGDVQAHLLHGFICWKQNELPAAEESFRRALSIDPADTLAHCLIGQVLEETGRRVTAGEHYRRALQIDPRCVWAKRLLEPT